MKHSSQSIVASTLSLGAVLAALGACTITPAGSQNSYKGGSGKLELERIEGNKFLAASLQIVNPIAKMDNGIQIAQFELKNTQSVTKRFSWAVDWYDADGFRIDNGTHHFEPVSLGGYGSIPIKITAPKAGEKFQWKLIISDPNEVH